MNSTPFRTPATGKYPLRARRTTTTTTNTKNATRLLNTTSTISRAVARPVRTVASKKLQPTLSVFDLVSTCASQWTVVSYLEEIHVLAKLTNCFPTCLLNIGLN